jgi:hypothetical protein
MKPKLLSSFIFCSILFLISCDKNEQHPLTVGEVEKSECKSSFKSTITGNDAPDTLSCIEYAYDHSNKKLNIKHINAGFNCCAGKIECDVSLQSDTIFILEFETSAACNCNCLYDLEFKIGNVEKTIYKIKLVEPYSGNEKKINFEIDLSKESIGEWCVTRKGYPWGMN